MIERVLILSPHTDDGEVSVGGTISRFVHEGKQVFYAAFSSCEKSVPDGFPPEILRNECYQATGKLNISKRNVIIFDYEVRNFPEVRQKILNNMIALRADIRPDLVICPSSFDIHQDHHVIYTESVIAFKRTATIWGMEHPWNNASFRTDILVELSDEYLDNKISAIKEYKSQSARDYFNEDYLRSCASTRGMSAGVRYAEAFECIRMMM